MEPTIMIVVAVVVVALMAAYFIYRKTRPNLPSIPTPELDAVIRKDYADRFGPKPPTPPIN